MNEKQIRVKLKNYAQELYDNYHPEFIPLYPFVLVYVLPKEQKVGSIYTPVGDKQQNKVTYEGVVLKTWDGKWINSGNGAYKEQIFQISQLQLGDHVLFPHYAGQPVSSLTDKDFRLVKECPTDENDDYIHGKVNYNIKSVKERFCEEISYYISNRHIVDDATDALVQKFVVYPKASCTLSGK